MIQEMQRRLRVAGIQTGYYSSPDPYPTPCISLNFMNRLINVQKLIDVGFIQAPPSKHAPAFIKKMRLPDKQGFNITGNIRLMEKRDAD